LDARVGRFRCEYLVQWKDNQKLEERIFIRSDRGGVTTTNTWEKLENIIEYKHLVKDWKTEDQNRRQKKLNVRNISIVVKL
jgi:hypothetical protein